MSPRVHGLDASYVQRAGLDFQAAADAGEEFFILKASEGNTGKDAAYQVLLKSAAATGKPVGAYHFARPSSDDQDAIKELENFFAACGGWGSKPGQMPPTLDLESTKLVGPQTFQWVQTWIWLCYQYFGKWPILYTGSYFWNGLGKEAAVAEWVKNCPIWIAQYRYDYKTRPAEARVWMPSEKDAPRVPAPWDKWDLWQFAGTGGPRPAGAKIDVDRNVFNGDLETFRARFGL